MNKTQKLLTFLLILIILTLACNMPGDQAISNEDIQNTFIAETISAIDQIITDQPATDVPTPTKTTPTLGSESTMTLTPTVTLTPTPTQLPIPCNKAMFMSDVTFVDGSEITVNESFVKTWRLNNNGSCSWTSGYKLIFSHGDRMGAPNEIMLTNSSIEPAETTEVSVNLIAPSTPGTYKGYFKLKAPDGQIFGVGASGNDPFYVEIKVVPQNAPETFVPDSVPAGDPAAVIKFTGEIKCKQGLVTYYKLKLKVTNDRPIVIRSQSVTIKNYTTNQLISHSADVFGTSTDCVPSAVGELAQGGTVYIASDSYNKSMKGTHFLIVIKLCTMDGLAGTCIQETIEIKP